MIISGLVKSSRRRSDLNQPHAEAQRLQVPKSQGLVDAGYQRYHHDVCNHGERIGGSTHDWRLACVWRRACRFGQKTCGDTGYYRAVRGIFN